MYFVFERAERILEALQKQSIAQEIPLKDWEIREGFFLRPEEADGGRFTRFDTDGTRWGGYDAHCWFRRTFSVPESFDGRPLWLNVRTELDGWDATNPQFLVFLNGKALQGMDTNHREVLLTSCAHAGDELRIDLQAYAGRFEEPHRLMASLAEADPEVAALYWDLCVPLRIIKMLEKEDHTRLKLENVLTETLNRIDLREARSAEFLRSVGEARAYIQQALYSSMAGNDEVVATCIGHTHIDVAWHWTVAQTREKTARSFSTVLKLMDEYPDYKFMSSQPQLYQFLKERYPELYEKIRQRIREGRWEPEGGMWLEADCNLTSGESLVRQLLYGKRFFREEFGLDNRIVWLPDVFGYSAALPQIMRKAGIDYFMTTKIAWNEFNKLPYDTFWWRGIDGTEIFTHLITTKDPDQSRDSFFTTYNGNLRPESLIGGWERYQQKELNNDILVCYGFGDGGGGPTREMLENGMRLQKGLPGAPKVRLETARTFFDELYGKLKDNKRVPRWDGELYLEYHRGTYTSMARNKRDNRFCELRYRDAEFLSVWANLLGSPYPQEEFHRAWQTILLNQFHDILPGSSIKDVYEVTKEEYAELLELAARISGEKLQAIASEASDTKDGGLMVCNTLSFPRTDVAVSDKPLEGISAAEGQELPCQRTFDGGAAFLVREAPAMGVSFLRPGNHAPDGTGLVAGVQAQEGTFPVENAFYKVILDSSGNLVSLWDKRAQREVLSGTGNVLRVYEDRPACFDNWNIDIYYKEKYWDVEQTDSAQWIERGPVRAIFETQKRFLHSSIRQRIIFYAHTARIDFDTRVDWQQSQLLLKTLFPVSINANQATFDIQFGNVQRPTHYNTSWDTARYETCAHKWADLSEDGFGVSLLNNCKYGYDVHEGTLALTLIKSGIEPNPETDREEHFFTYSLYPHTGGWREGGTVQEAEMLNAPLAVLPAAGTGTDRSLFTPDADNVLIDAVKLAEDGDGIILRLHEFKNRRGGVSLACAGRILSAVECNLLEETVGDVEVQGRTLFFSVAPFEIKTFRIRMDRPE